MLSCGLQSFMPNGPIQPIPPTTYARHSSLPSLCFGITQHQLRPPFWHVIQSAFHPSKLAIRFWRAPMFLQTWYVWYCAFGCQVFLLIGGTQGLWHSLQSV